MKITINTARVIVGLLFIFSGLIKANDPHGLEYKMHEFFETWGWHQNYSDVVSFSFKKIFPFVTGNFQVWMVKHTLLTSVLMNAFEIIAGFALLTGWRIKLFSWLLLFLIVFFTFLTGYTYITGKPTNCGCFGDCIPITSKTSFLKDVALAILIGFLFWQRKKITPLFAERTNTLTMLGITLFSFGFQWYTLTYLPLMDCLPFKKGNNISEQMQKPANAIADSTVISFVYEKEGKEVEFTADNFPTDFNDSVYKFKSRYDKMIRKGKNNEAPIKSFVLTGADNNFDSAAILLAQPYAVLLISEDPSATLAEWEKDFAVVYSEARQKNIPVYAITSVRDAALSAFSTTKFAGIQVFSCDNVTIRTAARTNPCIYLVQKGTITNKQSFKRINKIAEAIKTLPAQPAPQTDNNLHMQDTINQQPVTGNQ